MPTPLFYSTEEPKEILLVKSDILREQQRWESFIESAFRDIKEFQKEKDDLKNAIKLQLGFLEEMNPNLAKQYFNDAVKENRYFLFDPSPLGYSPPGSTNQLKTVKGIAFKFASLRTTNDIKEFAQKYGMLGTFLPLSQAGMGSYTFTPSYDLTVLEPLNTWKSYIKHIQGLLKLYQAITEAVDDEEVIGYVTDDKSHEYAEWLKTRKIVHFSKEGEEKVILTNIYRVYSREARQQILNLITNNLIDDALAYEEKTEIDKRTAFELLATILKEALSDEIKVSFSEILPSKDTKTGFRLKESYITSTLLVAIYYDLWRLISEETEVEFCLYCGRPFPRKGKKKYCNDSCRQMGYQRRKKQKNQRRNKADGIS